MLDIYNNKNAFLNKKPINLLIIVLVFIIIFSTILIYTIKFKIYDNYQTKGLISCEKECLIITYIPTNISYEKIKINNKDLEHTLISKELIIDEKEFISYYKVTLKSEEKFNNKEIIDLNFYYNKLIRKL